jgi:hypothetical protein
MQTLILLWRGLATCRHIPLTSPPYSPWSRHRHDHCHPCRYIPRRPVIAALVTLTDHRPSISQRSRYSRFLFSCEEKYSPLSHIGAAAAVATPPPSSVALYNIMLPAAPSFTLAPASQQASFSRPATLPVNREPPLPLPREAAAACPAEAS